MFKLASIIVRDGALAVSDAVGWTVRLAATLEIIHRVGAAHGRVSPKALQVLGKSYQAGGFVLDAPDLVDDVAYQSPERLDRGQPNPQDDAWATGVTLYELLTGIVPFAGSTPAEVLAKTLGRPPTPLADYGIDHPCLQRVLSRTLALDRAKRITTIAVLKEQLVACFPELDELPPLKLGKPDLALLSEAADDDGANLTAVTVDLPPVVLRARAQEARAQTAKAITAAGAPPMPPPPTTAAEGDEEAPEEDLPTRLLERSPKAMEDIALKVAEAARRRQAELAVPGVDGPPLAPGEQPPANEPAIRLPGLLDDETDWGQRGADSGPGSSPGDEGAEEPATVEVDDLPPETPPSKPVLEVEARRAAESATGVAPAASAESPPARPARRARKRPGRWRDMLLNVIFLCAGGGAAYELYGTDLDYWRARWANLVSSATGESQPVPAVTAEPTRAAPAGVRTGVEATASAGKATAEATPSSDASAAPSASATATASSSAAAPPGDLSACMLPLFPEDTFAFTKPYFDFVCTETDARKGGNSLRIQVIRSGGGARGVTQGMREWAELGWYEMAAFTVARTLCCPSPPPIETAGSTADCPIDAKLGALAEAVVSGDDAAVEAAMTEYTEVIQCLTQAGAAAVYGHRRLPGSRATRVFRSIVKRAREAAKSR